MRTSADKSDRLADFYAGKTVLVTGHTGFKGAWLSLWLTRLGARVVGLSLPEADDPSRALFQPAVAVSLAIDVRDGALVKEALAAHRPEIVIHLAAQSLVGRSGDDPIGTFAVNVMGTAHVLDAACGTAATRAVLNVTSDKCYANAGRKLPFREDDPLGGNDPYSASKACSELVTAAWRRSLRHGRLPALATARAGNVIGGGDWAPRRIVPDIVRALAAGQPVKLRHPAATRPWQHVLDPLHGYLLLARALHGEPERYEGPWNFGPDPRRTTEVRELARLVHARWGRGSAGEEQGEAGVPEAETLALDSAKAARELGWRPALAIDRTIELTVDWYRRVIEHGDDAIRASEAQIAEFEAACRETGDAAPRSAAARAAP